MSLSDLANLVEILGILALVFGVAFGIAQLKQHRIQRRDLAIVECARSFEDRDFTEAYRLLSDLDADLSKTEFDALGDEYEVAAIRVGMKFETIGLLIHKGVIPIDAMEDLVGGAALTIWRVLHIWAKANREYRSDRFWEWYEWLVDRLLERGGADRDPAFVAHADWKEPRA